MTNERDLIPSIEDIDGNVFYGENQTTNERGNKMNELTDRLSELYEALEEIRDVAGWDYTDGDTEAIEDEIYEINKQLEND